VIFKKRTGIVNPNPRTFDEEQ